MRCRKNSTLNHGENKLKKILENDNKIIWKYELYERVVKLSITNILKELSTRIPNKAAIIDTKNSERISFGYLEKNSSKIANMFKETGLKEGDGVLIFLPMSVALYSTLIAIFKMNLTAIFIDPYADIKYIENCCKLFPPRGLVIADKKIGVLGLLNKGIRKIPHKFILEDKIPFYKNLSEYENYSDKFDSMEIAGETKALITFTNEDGGIPKITARSHEFLLHQQEILSKALDIDKDSKVLVSLPTFLFSNISSGITSIVPSVSLKKIEDVDGNEITNQIAGENIDTIIAPPVFFSSLIEIYKNTGKNIHSIKKVYTGGSPVFPTFLEDLKKLFPYAEIKTIYGSAEAEPVAELFLHEVSDEDIEKMKIGNGLLVGKVREELELEIIENRMNDISENDKTEFLPKGSYGEIVVTGKHVQKSYLSGIVDDRIKINNEIWHKTGDLGYLDEENRLWLLGRAKAEIIKGNKSIYPFSVETILSFEKNIVRTAILELKGRIILFVELVVFGNEKDFETQDIMEEKINGMNLGVDKVIFIEKIPVDKRHNGKVDYNNLSKIAEKYN